MGPGSRVVCGTNLRGLANALMVYANDTEALRLPPADKWCDVLIQNEYTSPQGFVCRQSDAIVGESSYAINKNVAGKDIRALPGDVVFLFETDFGKDPNGRSELIKNRAWYKAMPYGNPQTKVYKNRWNQAGGPEILTTKHHEGNLCNVAFIDTHVKVLGVADLVKLKWKVGDPERAAMTKSRLKMLYSAVNEFKMDTARYPTAAEGLRVLVERWNDVEHYRPGGYLDSKQVPKDGWGNDFVYELYPPDGRDFVIISYGADGKAGGEGDDADLTGADF